MARNNAKKPIDRLYKRDAEEGNVNSTDTAKLNYTASSLGNDKGSIAFGHIHEKGDVTSGVMLRTPDGKHQMSMDIDGERKGWTTFTGPGNFTVEAGEKNEKIMVTIMINSKKGDIDIIANDGNIKLEANNIELIARGEGGSEGNITCTATENFTVKDTKKVLIDASVAFTLSTTGIGNVTANSCLNLYGSIIKGVTDACGVKPSKNSNKSFWDKQQRG